MSIIVIVVVIFIIITGGDGRFSGSGRPYIIVSGTVIKYLQGMKQFVTLSLSQKLMHFHIQLCISLLSHIKIT
jgi:hypothetical protein